MAKPYSDDLRRKFLQSYDRGQASLEKLAGQYGVSVGWAKKISARRTRTGQIDFVPYRRGPKSRVTDEVKQWLRARVRPQADLTLMELQRGLVEEQKVQLSVSQKAPLSQSPHRGGSGKGRRGAELSNCNAFCCSSASPCSRGLSILNELAFITYKA